MRWPIRLQFMMPLLSVALLSLVAIGVYNARLVSRETKARIERQLRGVTAVLENSNYPLTDSVLEQMGGLAHAIFVVTDREGQRVTGGFRALMMPLPELRATAGSSRELSLRRNVILDGSHYLHASIPLERRSGAADGQVLHIFFPQVEYDLAWRAAFIPPLVVGLLTMSALTLVTRVVAGRVGTTLYRLGEDVQRMARGDFSEVPLPNCNDETRDLSLAINQTARQLSQYAAELRTTERLRTVSMLGAGLAHEMRNAATGCRLAVDLHSEACPMNGQDECLEMARRQLQEIENRLQQLLQIGKGTPQTIQQPVDFAQVVSAAVSLAVPSARHAGVELSWDPPSTPCVVLAHRQTLEQTVTNLLLNAIHAASVERAHRGGMAWVRVALESSPPDARLTIDDSGIGPAPSAARDIFTPFETSKPEGVGIGLAIAKQHAESHRGSLDWSREDGFTRFCLRLPELNPKCAESLHG